MPRTSRTAEQRIYEFLFASKTLPALKGRWPSTSRPAGGITPSRWGANVSRRYRKAHPERCDLFDTLDRLRNEHRAENAKFALKRELRRLLK